MSGEIAKPSNEVMIKWYWWTKSFQQKNFGKYPANKVKKKYKQNIDEH